MYYIPNVSLLVYFIFGVLPFSWLMNLPNVFTTLQLVNGRSFCSLSWKIDSALQRLSLEILGAPDIAQNLYQRGNRASLTVRKLINFLVIIDIKLATDVGLDKS